MKKSMTMLVVFVLCILAVFADTPKKKLNKGGYYHDDNSYSFDKELTPENSVVVYFSTAGAGADFVYSQMNPNKEPLIFPLKNKGSSMIFPLVEPGSFLKAVRGSFSTAGVQYIFCDSLNSAYRLDIQVPSKPGLYFAGVIAPFADYSSFETLKLTFGNIKTQEDYDDLMRRMELKALKDALSKFKKTDWEPVITARIEELSK